MSSSQNKEIIIIIIIIFLFLWTLNFLFYLLAGKHTGSFDFIVYWAAAFACWSTSTLPRISLWPGTQSKCKTLPFSVICLMTIVLSILIVGIWLWKAVIIALGNLWKMDVLSRNCSISAQKICRLIWIPTSLPVQFLLWWLTYFLNSAFAVL